MSLMTFGHVSRSEIVISPKILPGGLTVSFLNFFFRLFLASKLYFLNKMNYFRKRFSALSWNSEIFPNFYSMRFAVR